MTRPRTWTESEADTRAERIDPVLARAGWGAAITPGSLVRREVVAPGRLLAGNRRAEAKTADYVFIHHSQALAVLEAKKYGLGATAGVGQAKDYADRLGVRFAYASDGDTWYAIDMDTGWEGPIEPDALPSPADLWTRTFGVPPIVGAAPSSHAMASPGAVHLNDWRLRFGDVGFEAAGGKWEPRYYQRRAIDAALDAVGTGRNRILLTLATGTGKTAIAFQIAWRLYQSSWNLSGKPGRRPRILFLAERNILADQAVMV